MRDVHVHRGGDVATVTLSNPDKKNAIPPGAWPQLEAVFREIAMHPEIRCVVLTGAGDDFSAGADLSAVGSDPDRHPLAAMRSISAALHALQNLPQPTIARICGVCVGVGMNLALGCDLTVAAADARLAEIFPKRGLSIDGGGSWLLPRLIGLHRAKELALLGDEISARDAERLGLLNRVVPRAELDAAVSELALRLAAGPPLALSMTKKLLNQSASMTLAEALEAEAQAQVVNFSTKDTLEAVAAFLERREPRFEGR